MRNRLGTAADITVVDIHEHELAIELGVHKLTADPSHAAAWAAEPGFGVIEAVSQAPTETVDGPGNLKVLENRQARR